jgi:hypothetical protein
MTIPEIEKFCVRFTGKNDPTWEFQFRMLKGKSAWSHLDDVSEAPTEKGALYVWETKEAQIITWTLTFRDY